MKPEAKKKRMNETFNERYTYSVALLFSTINETNRCLENIKIRYFYKVNNDRQTASSRKLHMCDVKVPISDRGWNCHEPSFLYKTMIYFRA